MTHALRLVRVSWMQRVGARQNNIQLRILRELPVLPEDEPMRELRDFLTM